MEIVLAGSVANVGVETVNSEFSKERVLGPTKTNGFDYNGFVGPDSFFVRPSVSMGHDLWAPSRCVGPGCTPQHPSWNRKTCKSVPPPPPAPPLSPLEKRLEGW